MAVLTFAAYGGILLAEELIYRNGHPLVIRSVPARNPVRDPTWMGVCLAAYAGLTLVVFTLYGLVLVLTARGRCAEPRVRRQVLVLPVASYLLLLAVRPMLSIDAYSYLAHGLLAVRGLSPYLHPAAQLLHTPDGGRLVAAGWQSVGMNTPYGPAWTLIESGIARVAPNVAVAVFLFKLIATLAVLASAVSIWWILGVVRPSAQLLGTVAFVWNPLVIGEFAGEGHNDALVIAFTLAGIALLVRGKPAGLIGTWLGVLTKFVPLIFGLAQVVFLLRTIGARRTLQRGSLVALAAGLLTVVLAAPLWVGLATFSGLRQRGAPLPNASVPGTVLRVIRHSPLRTHATNLTALLIEAIVAILIVTVSMQARDARTLCRACALASLGYVVLASTSFWPWYIALPVALLCLTPEPGFLALAVLLSLGARLFAPYGDVVENGFRGVYLRATSPLYVGILLPLAVWTAFLLAARIGRVRRLMRPVLDGALLA